MSLREKRKTLIDIDLSTWARVKHFATIRRLSLNKALEVLLEKELDRFEYKAKRDQAVSVGKSLATNHQQIPSSGEVQQ